MKLPLVDAGDDSGDAFLVIPEDLLELLGWRVGETVNIDLKRNESDEFILMWADEE